jgi:hypothetical protein
LNPREWCKRTAITRKKPFDVLAEGLISKNSRGDWTPLELFLAGVEDWEAVVQRRVTDEMLAK